MAEPAPSASRRSGFPSWVLLDTAPRIGSCSNETTARGTTSAGCPIEVSFVVADPPGLSRCVVDCPDLMTAGTTDEAAASLSVVAADGAFLLVRVFFPERDDDGRRMFTDLFVYRAGPGAPPSLSRLPQPYPPRLRSHFIGVLSCGNDGEYCSVVVPERRVADDGRVRYHLRVFSTKTGSWSTVVPRVGCGADRCYGEFEPSKVLSVAGGSLAWVDLRNGILLCKELEGDPEMVLIQLPALMPSNREDFGVDSLGIGPIRDVTFRNGRFRFAEMEFLGLCDRNTLQPQWRATVFERGLRAGDSWEWRSTVDLDLSPADSCLFPHLPPEIYDCEEKRLTFDRVMSMLLALDQYHDDIVYMICKADARDTRGWILAVNSGNKKLEKIAPFCTERLFFRRTYLQCAFSKYLSKVPGVMKENSNKDEDQLQLIISVISILVVQHKLRQFCKEPMAHRKGYNEAWLVLHSDLALTLHLHIQQVVQYAASSGDAKCAYDAIATFKGAKKEIDNSWSDPSVCDEAIRDRICVAVEALDKILLLVPSDVLDAGRRGLSVVCKGDEE